MRFAAGCGRGRGRGRGRGHLHWQAWAASFLAAAAGVLEAHPVWSVGDFLLLLLLALLALLLPCHRHRHRRAGTAPTGHPQRRSGPACADCPGRAPSLCAPPASRSRSLASSSRAPPWSARRPCCHPLGRCRRSAHRRETAPRASWPTHPASP